MIIPIAITRSIPVDYCPLAVFEQDLVFRDGEFYKTIKINDPATCYSLYPEIVSTTIEVTVIMELDPQVALDTEHTKYDKLQALYTKRLESMTPKFLLGAPEEVALGAHRVLGDLHKQMMASIRNMSEIYNSVDTYQTNVRNYYQLVFATP